MEFSVVEIGNDRDRVDVRLKDLGERLARTAARAEAAAEVRAELDLVREEVERLRALLGERAADHRRSSARSLAEEEAAEILGRARTELMAAQDEAQRIRDEVYAEALQARRDFEAALYARRIREQQVDEILREVTIIGAPVEEPGRASAPGGVPATRAG